MAMEDFPRPWPGDAMYHEIQTLVKWLGDQDDAPPEVRGEEIEAGFERPMIGIAPLSTGVIEDGQFRYEARRNITLTWWGSDRTDVDSAADLPREAYRAADWLAQNFGRNGDINGPYLRILDFSGEEPTPADGWMLFDQQPNIYPSQDEYDLWRITVDLRYTVERGGEEDATGPIITGIVRKVTITNVTG